MAGFVARRRVEFAHTDMAGVVHFSEFARYMESAEHEFFRSIGCSVDQTVGGRRVSWPRVSCAFDFLRPLRFEDEFEIVLGIERLGEKSVTWRAEFCCGDALCAQGRMTTACCELDQGEMKAVSIPSRVRDAMGVIFVEATS
jgi:YbgC/YbaW family acyl-CoA thioester hydrolase